ncbi:hypothetical protein FOZ76_02710 [Verticiella sediminum]|uniref:Uncharacterized protein n=1 Tax=Verticiella sediminum TaxID=1247510 RepID=A0A556B1P3_9BURK|nr:hypothetical protein [Verticiella sediminum]TSH98675.1 hypothetical protein FOZ76_02710 [Verticiella sediminum]
MFRQIQATLLAAALTTGFGAGAAHAGTDTIIHFANLSPYTAKVEFPTAMQDCWHDTGAEEDSRVAEYYDYFRRAAVSADGYRDFLAQFQQHVGVKDFAALPGNTMAGTSAALAPSANGKPAAMAVFRGETSAELFGGCKDATSSRGFRVTLLDGAGSELSRQHYVIQDPPGSQWRVMRLGADVRTPDQTVVMGSGGTAHPLDIALTAFDVVSVGLTVVSLGTATAELLAARVMIREAAAELAKYGLEYNLRKAMFNYALVGGMRTLQSGTNVYVRAGLTRAVAARVVYTMMADGAVWYLNTLRDDSNPNGFDGTTADVDYDTVGLDLSKPDLVVMNGLPDDRSICVYETTTFGIRECRLVGVSFNIMADGSLVFMPLPGVGAGD